MSELVTERLPSAGTIARALRTRHEHTLGGALLTLDGLHATSVVLSASAASARALVGQHLILQLANLLGRLDGVVSSIVLKIDGGDVTLCTGVDPWHPDGGASLSAATNAVAALAVPYHVNRVGLQAERVLVIRIGGPSSANNDVVSIWVAADDWRAFVGRHPGPECAPEADLPFGAHAAAAIAAAEVFKLTRAKGELGQGPRDVVVSTWSLTQVDRAVSPGPTSSALKMSLQRGIPPFTLVGVGAVGSACLLTLWSSGMAVPDATVIDGDTISWTNLNRYILFGIEDHALSKAMRVAALLTRTGDAPFKLRPEYSWWADYRRRNSESIPLLISTVDKNTVRHQLQDALPKIILGASTHSLRAQVNRYDLSHTLSPCLKCHNPPELIETDEAMRVRLTSMDNAAIRVEAIDRGVNEDSLMQYVTELRAGGTGCAIVTGDDLEKLRHADGEGAFSVSFVSALAGTFLAAQLVREVSEREPALSPMRSRGNFQLWRPDGLVNAPQNFQPQANCWCAKPATRAVFAEMWPSHVSGSPTI